MCKYMYVYTYTLHPYTVLMSLKWPHTTYEPLNAILSHSIVLVSP